MELSKLIDVKQNFEKRIDQKLLEMVCFFQDRMWDGSDADETDPKFVSREDFEAIEALSDKIKHMIIYIGSPISVEPMLQSIVTRRIKHWQAADNIETTDKTRYEYDEKKGKGRKVITSKGFKKGKQLKNNNDLRRVYESEPYYKNKVQDRVISGHFRWNNRGYILSRLTTDLLGEYLETKF